MDYNKLEQLQNEFFEKLEHTHTVIEMKMLVEWYKQAKKDLDNDSFSGCYVPTEKKEEK